MKTIAIILPAYNEELTIAQTIEDFYTHKPEATIVVVNNCSKDGTQKIAEQTLTRLQAKGFVINEERAGKGNAVRTGLRSIKSDIYILADADMTYPARHIDDLIIPVINGTADMTVGDRISNGKYRSENKRHMHNFGNNLVLFLVNALFKSSLNDIMSGYRCLSRHFVKNYPLLSEGFQLETDMTLHALDKRFRIKELPIDYQDRPEGSESKLNTLSDGLRVLYTIINIFRHYRPLVFFMLIACGLVISSLIVGAPVFDDWQQHRYIYHIPSAILASSLALLAALLSSVGLILDAINYHQRMDYEKDLND
jgi:glycosyltransferase involved in cell wall biosynthesis